MALKRLPREYLLLAALVIAITLITLPTISYPLGRDQGEFATIARGILDGRIPYLDLWNPKPPAVFYTYALAMTLFGRSTEALRVIDLLLYPPLALALYWIGKRIASGRVGLWAALLFGVFYFAETFWTLTQNDGIALLPMVLAVVCALKAADEGKRSALWAFGVGVLSACALWFKYPFVLFVGVPVFIYLWQRRRIALAIHWRDLLAFVAGGLLIGLGGILYMLAIGAWAALLESAIVTASYTAQGLATFGAALSTALGFRWQHWGVLFGLALVALVIGVRRFSRRSRWWIAVVWLVAGTAIMLVQLKFYDYHWLPMLPALTLIAAGALEVLFDLIARRISGFTPYLRGIAVVALLAALAAVILPRTLPYLTGQQSQAAYYHQFQAGEFVADESLAVAAYLRERVAPGDSLFIWGFRPEVYYLSGLNPAARFIFQFPLVANWYPPQWQQQTVDTLGAALPPYVLVVQADYMPWVTGSDQDSNTLLQAYTELNNWLKFNYERDTQIGNFFLWRRISIPR